MRRTIQRFLARGRREELRVWPLASLLVLVLLGGMAGVGWFMREAIRNERLAARERLAEAHRGSLIATQARLQRELEAVLTRLDAGQPGQAWFAECIRGGGLDSMVCLGPDGRPVYPEDATGKVAATAAPMAEALHLQAGVRDLVGQGDHAAAIERVATADAALAGARDAEGRLILPALELFALELMEGTKNPRHPDVAKRLAQRLNDYHTIAMPAAQRRFLMGEMSRLALSPASFPTRHAEDLAARVIEGSLSPLPSHRTLAASPVDGLWQISSPGGKAIALFSSGTLTGLLARATDSSLGIAGARVHLIAPGTSLELPEEPLALAPAGAAFPRWQLGLTLDDPAHVTSLASRRTALYLWTGILVVTAMTLAGGWTVRAIGRQIHVARLRNTLTATVSHELKTPLTSMRLLVDTLLESETLDPVVTREYLCLIAQENARLSRLIDNVLTFSRFTRNGPNAPLENIDPAAVITSTMAAFGDRCSGPECAIEVDVPQRLPAIRGDRDALVTALLNLLENAWKYTGSVKRIGLRATVATSVVRFVVEDNGPGIPACEHNRIFRPFYQMDQRLTRSAGGCGLGLGIVQAIAHAHGGKVNVVSEPGRGSVFTLEIPTAQET